jgi:hypothetical protein
MNANLQYAKQKLIVSVPKAMAVLTKKKRKLKTLLSPVNHESYATVIKIKSISLMPVPLPVTALMTSIQQRVIGIVETLSNVLIPNLKIT